MMSISVSSVSKPFASSKTEGRFLNPILAVSWYNGGVTHVSEHL